MEHPWDTPQSALTRFAVEVVAWIAGPWAAASVTGNGWIALPALLLLVLTPAVFSTPGDKNQVIVPTPGPARIALELGLLVVAIAGAARVWPTWSAIIVMLLGLAMLVTGRNRLRWLARGAPAGDSATR